MGGGGGCIPLEFPPQKIIARMDFETDPWNLSQPQLSLRKICNWFLSLTLPLQALPPHCFICFTTVKESEIYILWFLSS